IGFVKAVIPIIDLDKVQRKDSISELQSEGSNNHNQLDVEKVKSNIKKGLKIMMSCDFCHRSISGDAQVMKFANYERLFCCATCKSEYKRKYGGRIEAINKRKDD
ncbi:MAG: TRASH domain-containing protein, partial [Nitrososphaeraceae archaeon]